MNMKMATPNVGAFPIALYITDEDHHLVGRKTVLGHLTTDEAGNHVVMPLSSEIEDLSLLSEGKSKITLNGISYPLRNRLLRSSKERSSHGA
jgi:hypothetical protein